MFSNCVKTVTKLTENDQLIKTGNILRKCLSSQEIIDRESKYACHNYHPLPVALSKGQGKYNYKIRRNFLCCRRYWIPNDNFI